LDLKVRDPLNMLVERIHNDTHTQRDGRRAGAQQLLPVTDGYGGIVGLPEADPPIATKRYYPNK
jgi:hypothetical protein